MKCVTKSIRNKYKIRGLTQLEYDLLYAGLMQLCPTDANDYVSRQYHTDCCPLHHYIEKLARSLEPFTTRRGECNDEADEVLFQ